MKETIENLKYGFGIVKKRFREALSGWYLYVFAILTALAIYDFINPDGFGIFILAVAYGLNFERGYWKSKYKREINP